MSVTEKIILLSLGRTSTVHKQRSLVACREAIQSAVTGGGCAAVPYGGPVAVRPAGNTRKQRPATKEAPKEKQRHSCSRRLPSCWTARQPPMAASSSGGSSASPPGAAVCAFFATVVRAVAPKWKAQLNDLLIPAYLNHPNPCDGFLAFVGLILENALAGLLAVSSGEGDVGAVS